ncbi:hypothetical protein BsWGS_28746 [Bradybaena similaris]
MRKLGNLTIVIPSTDIDLRGVTPLICENRSQDLDSERLIPRASYSHDKDDRRVPSLQKVPSMSDLSDGCLGE